MGKFLETLRQTTVRPAPQEAPARDAAPAPAVVEEDMAEEEVPYIEVGPHRSMEASASVLATRPGAAAKVAPAPRPAPSAVTFRPSAAETLPRGPHFAAEVVAHHQPDHPISGQYRELLAALTPAVPGEAAAALLLTPALPGADVSAVLLNLAVTAARKGGRRVIVVDADLRQPTLAERLGLSARPGLAEVLAGNRHPGTGVAADRPIQSRRTHRRGTVARWAASRRRNPCLAAAPGCASACGLALVLGPHWIGRPDAPARRRLATWSTWCFPNRKPALRKWTSCCKRSRVKAPVSAAAFSPPAEVKKGFTTKTQRTPRKEDKRKA